MRGVGGQRTSGNVGQINSRGSYIYIYTCAHVTLLAKKKETKKYDTLFLLFCHTRQSLFVNYDVQWHLVYTQKKHTYYRGAEVPTWNFPCVRDMCVCVCVPRVMSFMSILLGRSSRAHLPSPLCVHTSANRD